MRGVYGAVVFRRFPIGSCELIEKSRAHLPRGKNARATIRASFFQECRPFIPEESKVAGPTFPPRRSGDFNVNQPRRRKAPHLC